MYGLGAHKGDYIPWHHGFLFLDMLFAKRMQDFESSGQGLMACASTDGARLVIVTSDMRLQVPGGQHADRTLEPARP